MALPRDSKSTEGARALLFDRLVDLNPTEPVEQQPLRVLDINGVRESVQKELGRLLNTRSPTQPEVLESRDWTVLDWGLPDYSGWYTRSPPAQLRLARLIEKTIRTFEPRMVEPKVSVQVSGDNNRSLQVWIEGAIRIGTLLEPVSFPMALEGRSSRG